MQTNEKLVTMCPELSVTGLQPACHNDQQKPRALSQKLQWMEIAR